MIQHKLGLPIVDFILWGSLIPLKVQFWGSGDNERASSATNYMVFSSLNCEISVKQIR